MMNYVCEKLSVLYLDDEEVCLRLFNAAFAGEWEVRTASTRDEALRALAERGYDVVISDEVMPDFRGSDFLREVENKYPGSRRMLLSGAACVGQVLPALSMGAVEFFLPKPWSPGLIRQAIERAGLTA